MKSSEYREGVLRTESGKFDNHHVDDRVLAHVVEIFVQSGKALDAIKRGLYYGKEVNFDKLHAALDEIDYLYHRYQFCRYARKDATVDENGDIHVETCLPGFKAEPSVHPRVIHAAIGLGTESAEILEAVLNSLQSDTPLDYANFFEELGDGSYYMALGVDTASQQDDASVVNGGAREWTHEAIWQKNLSKLAARYPNKFDTERAYNRNINTEKKALE